MKFVFIICFAGCPETKMMCKINSKYQKDVRGISIRNHLLEDKQVAGVCTMGRLLICYLAKGKEK